MATILIVDDNADIRDIFAIFLTVAGFSTLLASGGDECLELLKTNHPDLILLDIMMEPMDGWRTLTLIKNMPESKDIPVVMVTGKAITEGELQKYSGQFKTYLMKPVTADHLNEAIVEILKL